MNRTQVRDCALYSPGDKSHTQFDWTPRRECATRPPGPVKAAEQPGRQKKRQALGATISTKAAGDGHHKSHTFPSLFVARVIGLYLHDIRSISARTFQILPYDHQSTQLYCPSVYLNFYGPNTQHKHRADQVLLNNAHAPKSRFLRPNALNANADNANALNALNATL